jgi:hypothetical protein
LPDDKQLQYVGHPPAPKQCGFATTTSCSSQRHLTLDSHISGKRHQTTGLHPLFQKVPPCTSSRSLHLFQPPNKQWVTVSMVIPVKCQARPVACTYPSPAVERGNGDLSPRAAQDRCCQRQRQIGTKVPKCIPSGTPPP